MKGNKRYMGKKRWCSQFQYHLSLSKYIAFNLVGFIYSIDQSTHNTINVEFHDRSQKPFHFTDHYGYSLACLGQRGAVFACESTHANPATLYYRPTDGWVDKNEWLIQLNTNENPKGNRNKPLLLAILSLTVSRSFFVFCFEAIAMTNKFIAVATDHRYIRFYSFGGIQIGLLCFKGPVVCIVGTAEHLLLVTHDGGTFHGRVWCGLFESMLIILFCWFYNTGDQNFTYSLYSTKQQCLHKDEMPVSPGSLLEWIGFSEDGVRYDCSHCNFF